MERLISTTHSEIYDQLAPEYEARADNLYQVTKDSLENFAPYVKPGGRFLDVGCGAGLGVEILTDMGFQAQGIELAPKMADVAKRRNSGADIIAADYLGYEFREKFDGAMAFAFIHLFPKEQAYEVLEKLHNDLVPGGVLLIGTTKSETSSEGWKEKEDYPGAPKRYRKHWTQTEFEQALTGTGFEILKLDPHNDPYGKTWLDYIVKTIC